MMKLKSGRFIVLLLAILLFSTLSVQAELYNRGTDSSGNRLIYDSDLNITWYDSTNRDTSWQNQMNWASALTVTFGENVFNDWRLPSTLDGSVVFSYDGSTSYGFNVTNSEMGHLYYTELGNKGACDSSGNCPQPGWGLLNKGPFLNLQIIAGGYWSGTSATVIPGYVYLFNFDGGEQLVGDKYGGPYAIAVHSGDVAIVPEPISSLLFVTGGTLLAGIRYLKRVK